MKYDVLITGADGFLGKNLFHSIKNNENVKNIYRFCKNDNHRTLSNFIEKSDLIFHFAATNRSNNQKDFIKNNEDLTKLICTYLIKTSSKKKLIFTSSIHSGNDSIYGQTKYNAENLVKETQSSPNIECVVYRLPGIFGKWAKPNYNSVVATFCYNANNNLPLKVNDKDKSIELMYIDDLVEEFINHLNIEITDASVNFIQTYDISLGKLASQIKIFSSYKSIENLNDPLTKKLLSTYQSYKKPEDLSYKLKENRDDRGSFTEIINTKNSGQISFLTSKPGITRGNHFHNTKFEKFLVLKGIASFKFRDLNTGECFEKITSFETPEVVETSPGWVHDITNIGSDEIIVLAWANENFDQHNPDTIPEVV
tara:strand:+ start:3166 stop:4269 length:1104 start_codon:yes stop_codon:yes gene_type:complete